MGFPILVRWHLYIESAPWSLKECFLNRMLLFLCRGEGPLSISLWGLIFAWQSSFSLLNNSLVPIGQTGAVKYDLMHKFHKGKTTKLLEWRICASVNEAIVGSANSLSPVWRQSIISTNYGWLSIRHNTTYCNKILKFSFHEKAVILSWIQCVKKSHQCFGCLDYSPPVKRLLSPKWHLYASLSWKRNIAHCKTNWNIDLIAKLSEIWISL